MDLTFEKCVFFTFLVVCGLFTCEAEDTNDPFTPLYASISNLQKEVAQTLQSSPNVVNITQFMEEGIYATFRLWTAAEKDDPSGIRDAIEGGANIDKKKSTGSSALNIAASNGFFGPMSVLLMAGADRESKTDSGDRPLHLAALNGHNAAVAVLALAGADLKAPGHLGMTPYLRATRSGKKSTAELIRALAYCFGNTNNTRNEEASIELFEAVKNNKPLKAADAILDGADVEWKNGTINSALSWATALGHVEVMSVLLKAGANTEATNARQVKPLHEAAMLGKTAAMALLAVAGAEMNSSGNLGDSPLITSDRFYEKSAAPLLRALGGWKYSNNMLNVARMQAH